MTPRDRLAQVRTPLTRIGEPRQDRSVRAEPLVHLDHLTPGHERRRSIHLEVVQGRTVLPPDLEQTSDNVHRVGEFVSLRPQTFGERLRPVDAAHDAELKFGVGGLAAEEPPECIAGIILQGLKKPYECPMFGTRCTPEKPLGAPMVSTEGACAAYHHYGRALA